MDLRHRHDRRRLRRVHDVAGIDIAQADPPVERRGDVAEAQVELRRFDLRIVARDRRGELLHHRLLGIQLLARGEILLHQRGIACQVGLRVGQLRLVLLLLRQRRVQRRLVRPGIDHRQQVALLDVLPLGDRHLRQRAIDPRPQLHRSNRPAPCPGRAATAARPGWPRGSGNRNRRALRQDQAGRSRDHRKARNAQARTAVCESADAIIPNTSSHGSYRSQAGPRIKPYNGQPAGQRPYSAIIG